MENRDFYLSRPWAKHYPEGKDTQVEVPDISVPEMMEQIARKHGHRPALIFHGTTLRYKTLINLSNRFASALQSLGVTKGDKVALYLLNCPQFVIAYLGALKAGALVTPISPVYTSFEVRHQLQDSQAKYLVCQDILFDKVEKSGVELAHVIVTHIGEYLPWWKRLAARLLGRFNPGLALPTVEISPRKNLHPFQTLLATSSPEPRPVTIQPRTDLATLSYTGGTTGNPKGVMLSHYNIVAAKSAIEAAIDLELAHEYVLAFLPLFHIYGQAVLMLGQLGMGNTLVLFTTPDLDEILTAMQTYPITVFPGVPMLFEVLKDHEKTGRVNWKKLKVILCGADTLHKTTVESWERRTGTRIREGYGLTESTSIAHLNPKTQPKIGSFGIPVANQDAGVMNPEGTDFLKVGEVGELVLSGPNIMQGYWNRPQDTAKTLITLNDRVWLRTGDLVSMDPEGYFHYYDRRKDLIKHKGYSVFAKDIEDILYTHPQVKAAGVVGVPDPTVGAQIKAVVVLQPEARGTLSEEDIRTFCKERLAHYKIPKFIEFRGELPKTDVGKISRRELRDEGTQGS
ncbi:MAG: AMP-binding protein [Deltaproteobacteria bacterium]|nr:AMP-binding protein [Deltaproteobacteria bacterium]